jgi:hypothetical protein
VPLLLKQEILDFCKNGVWSVRESGNARLLNPTIPDPNIYISNNHKKIYIPENEKNKKTNTTATVTADDNFDDDAYGTYFLNQRFRILKPSYDIFDAKKHLAEWVNIKNAVQYYNEKATNKISDKSDFLPLIENYIQVRFESGRYNKMNKDFNSLIGDFIYISNLRKPNDKNVAHKITKEDFKRFAAKNKNIHLYFDEKSLDFANEFCKFTIEEWAKDFKTIPIQSYLGNAIVVSQLRSITHAIEVLRNVPINIRKENWNNPIRLINTYLKDKPARDFKEDSQVLAD